MRLIAWVGLVMAVCAPGAGGQKSATWSALGPAQVASQRYGLITGRVTSVAIDPADATGNAVYVGTAGGGVWKSTNAAGPAGSVTFVPLTDTLPVFSGNAGTAVLPSLTIGAVSVNGGVVLAGTGDPNDATDSYYGEGILRTADGGVTWTVATGSHDGVAGNHSFVGLAVAGFAWSTQNSNLVVVAMSQSAEGTLVNAADESYSVMGLYYSMDAGKTWAMATLKDGGQVVQQPLPGGGPGNSATAVAWNAARQRFYAAVRFHGYYESVDGETWTRVTNQPGTGLTAAACPTNPGATGSTSCPIFRGAIAVQPATGDTFALTVDINNRDQGLWQDVCGAPFAGGSCAVNPIAFGKQLASTALEVGGGSTAIAQADYDLELGAVANGSDTLLFVGTEDLYRCSIGAGCVLRNTTNALNGCSAPAKVAASQHGIAVLAGAGTGGLPLVYVGSDGGLWRSADGVNQQQTPCSPDDANHFQNLNGGLGSLAEVVRFAEDPSDRGTLLAGLGANGTAATGNAASGGAWAQVATGEGGTVAIDAAAPQNWYASTGEGMNLRYCGSGNACSVSDFSGNATIGYAQVANDASLIAAPWMLDPVLTSDVVIGTCRVWRGTARSGSGWSSANAISTDMGTSLDGACGATSAMIRSLAAGGPASGVSPVQNAGSTVLYAGMAGRLDGGSTYAGHVFVQTAARTATATTEWMDVAKSPVGNDVADAGVFNPGGFDVSSVVADVHDSTGMTVYATVMGFARNGVNAPHVYRSLDGGGHWANISSNLPNAPANALLVDPNDANTVYVGMDSGLYATQAVTTCGIANTNCWSSLGTGLPNAPVVALQASAELATGDGRLGELRAGTYGRGIWEIPLLTAAAAAMPAMSLSPTSLSFAAQVVGTLSVTQAIVVTNSGNVPLVVTQIAMSGDFAETDTCVSASGGVAVGGTCALQVSFLPSATGVRTGLVTIYGNVTGGQATASLSGAATAAAAVVLNPVSATFSATNVGARSTAQNITVSNTGGTMVTLQTPVVAGDYAISASTCGATLGPSSGCTVSVVFAPTAAGVRQGTFSIADSVGTQTASLSGTGQLPATDTLSPLSLTFAAQPLNTGSGTQQVMLTNSGDAALTMIGAQVTSGDFAVVNGCGNSLNGHSSCALTVAFVPKGLGGQSGTLTVSDIYRSQTVSLSGTGLAPAGVSLAPVNGMTFGDVGVGQTAAAQTVTLTNNGGMSLAIQGLVASGDFGLVAGSNTCGATLAVGSSCAAQIVFTPAAGGSRNGALTVTDSAPGSPHTMPLSGVGVDFALASSGSTTQTEAAGSQAVYGLLLTSAAGVPGTAALTCTGAPAHATCVVNPASAALGGTTVITVTVATSVAGAAVKWPGQRRMMWLAALTPFGLLLLEPRLSHRAVLVVLACAVVALGGCGASRLIPSDSGGGSPGSTTPSGTYNLVVSGTSAGLTRTVGLSLVVQ